MSNNLLIFKSAMLDRLVQEAWQTFAAHLVNAREFRRRILTEPYPPTDGKIGDTIEVRLPQRFSQRISTDGH